jgi:hypothetical protein
MFAVLANRTCRHVFRAQMTAPPGGGLALVSVSPTVWRVIAPDRCRAQGWRPVSALTLASARADREARRTFRVPLGNRRDLMMRPHHHARQCRRHTVTASEPLMSGQSLEI